ncbi:MAG: MucBP domain-containing protein [Clostridia bacterium]|nr:MucBP domain-containing protein [Clostridia bacterium]
MFNKKLFGVFISLLAALALLAGIAMADGYASVSGSAPVSGLASETVSFTVTSYGSAKVTLFMYPGTASLVRSGKTTTESGKYGAFMVTCGSKLISWYNRAGNYPIESGVSQYVNRDTLVMSFSAAGSYTVTVTPFTDEQLNTLWGNNYFTGWNEYPAWECTSSVNCTISDIVISGSGDPYEIDFSEPGANTVAIRYEDTAGDLINYETRTVLSSGYIKAAEIAGYTAVSDTSRYISVSGGVCTPSTVTFVCQKNAVGAELQILCKDQNGNLIDSETRVITKNTYVYPKEITGYTAPAGRYVTYLSSRNACSPATVTFVYTKKSTAAALKINYVDQNGVLLDSETKMISANTTVSGKEISGYTLLTGSRTVTYSKNGTCSPSTVTFTYSKNASYALLTIRYTDTNGNILDTETRQITKNTTIAGKEISGYTLQTGSRYVTYLGNGTCSPSTVTFTYSKNASYALLTIRYTDTNGNILDTETRQITKNTTIAGKEISGYTLQTGSRYVTYLGNGVCSPSTVTFSYSKNASYATLTIRYTDESGNILDTETRRITKNTTVTGKEISGYTLLSGSTAVTYNTNGTCSPSTVTFTYRKKATYAVLTIYYVDENGNILDTETRNISKKTTISGKTISGYTLQTGSRSVSYLGDGVCSPDTLTFTYKYIDPEVTVEILGYDENDVRLYKANRTMLESGYISPREVEGYTCTSGKKYVEISGGTANPASVRFYYRRNAKSGKLIIEYKDENGTRIDREERTITESGTVSGKEIDGYVLSTGDQYVVLDTVNGICDPATITFTYIKNKTGSVKVTYVDTDGNVLDTGKVKIKQANETVSGKKIDGYVLITEAQKVKLNLKTGECKPASLTFTYRSTAGASEEATDAKTIMAQARTPVKAYYEDKNNQQQSLNKDAFNALKDGNGATSWTNTYWAVVDKSEDPDLTFTYKGETISYIWFRNGDYSGNKKTYENGSRPSEITVKVYCDSGTVTKRLILDDSWQAGIDGWQCIDLGQVCTGVTKVTFNFWNFKQGSSGYKFFISDIVAN